MCLSRLRRRGLVLVSTDLCLEFRCDCTSMILRNIGLFGWSGVGMYRVYLMSEEGLEWDDEGVVEKGELRSTLLVPSHVASYSCCSRRGIFTFEHDEYMLT